MAKFTEDALGEGVEVGEYFVARLRPKMKKIAIYVSAAPGKVYAYDEVAVVDTKEHADIMADALNAYYR